MADIMELMRMPEQAQRLRDYQPQPDPVAEQVKQLELQKLQLENMVLQATIQDKTARANENTIDADLKRNKAAVEAAKARKLNSDADMTDLKFVKEDEGFAHLQNVELADLKHAQELEKGAAKHRANIEQLLVQQRAGDRQLGVVR
jgi:hypothetical protein